MIIRLAQEVEGAGNLILRRNGSGSTNIAPVMTRFGRNSLEVAVAVGTIMVGTVIIHLIVSWWPALTALI
jgi:hypothetical protein